MPKFLDSKLSTAITAIIVLAAAGFVVKLNAHTPLDWASGFLFAAGTVLLSLMKSLAAPSPPESNTITQKDETKP